MLIAAGARIAWHAVVAQRESAAASSQLAGFQMNITNADLPAAKVALADAQRATRLAADATSGPLWRAASAVPYFGNSLRTFSGLTRAGDDAARSGLPALLEVADKLRPETFLRPDGGLDTSALAAAREPLTQASVSLTRARADVATLPRTGLVEAVVEGRANLTSSLDLALKTLHNVEVAARLAPGMLGADGSRRYLVTLKTSTEQSGAPAAFVLVDVVAGTPTIAGAGTEAVAGVQARSRIPIDGVVRVTPEALAAVLRSTGPVVTASGLSVDAEGAVNALSGSSESFFPDPATRAAFPAQALQAGVDALLRNPTVWSTYLLQDLGSQSAAGGLQLASGRPEEQAVLATTSLGRTPFTG